MADTSALTVPDKYLAESTPAAPVMTRDWALCRWLAKEGGVIAIPASPFYSPGNKHLGENYVRFAFCKSDETLREAAAKIEALHTRAAPAGGTSAEDGAAALESTRAVALAAEHTCAAALAAAQAPAVDPVAAAADAAELDDLMG